MELLIQFAKSMRALEIHTPLSPYPELQDVAVSVSYAGFSMLILRRRHHLLIANVDDRCVLSETMMEESAAPFGNCNQCTVW